MLLPPPCRTPPPPGRFPYAHAPARISRTLHIALFAANAGAYEYGGRISAGVGGRLRGSGAQGAAALVTQTLSATCRSTGLC